MNESTGKNEKGKKKEGIFDRHLKEIKAKSKAKSFNELVSRMRSEQEFRKTLERLSGKVHSQEIMPFLAIDRKKAEYPPDFLIWKNEFRIPIFLVEIIDNEKRISRKTLADFLEYVKRTDLTEALIVWMSPPDFPSVLLRIDEIETKVDSAEEMFVFDAKPFNDVVVELMETKERIWPVPKLDNLPQTVETEIMLKSFESMFRNKFIDEASRKRPRLPYRRDALKSITQETLEKIFLIFSEYMRGELSREDFARSFRSIAKDAT